jgi:hypothetical protein
MNCKTRKALIASIEHWRQNLDMLILNYLSGDSDLTEDIHIRSSSCPLCVLFIKKWSIPCRGCPVYKNTGYRDCLCSTWGRVFRWFNSRPVVGKKKDYQRGYRVISAEIKYLVSLLDKE